ncbi:hypothetical protein [Variovorax sp. YR266]|uniref:hypothetical protein n=1 Tax=Variovorax sp. YR266 TaxID=1884386 RepID=UPI00115FBBF6|nr:hypothetical protein [Variovorax sp. YR266]
MAIGKAPLEISGTQIHKQKNLPDDLIRFSFRHFSFSDKYCAPEAKGLAAYFPALMERLRDVSGFKVSEFRTTKSKALRAHTHDWPGTSEPNGYTHLNEQLRDCEAWQFQLSANEHGRIHGILVDSVFYVIWVDPNHALYPKKK